MNCMHLDTIVAGDMTQDGVYCPDCEKTFSESEWIDFKSKIKFDISYEHPGSYTPQRDSKTGWPKHIADAVERDKWQF
jgi:hypothetical protein